ncbi:endolytic transglycosylase MltG [Chelatococcus sp. SYSU_G07232]|uniref:Endolytic murein transglycosylase n=1 Tax=Chelatococcus albus TaxID=3047466 RepID=A0ABT7AJW6_9HYPH|nr:endolytic transglycosylase MltG [Chelatococcus sp. SYSU_G07232]MDJ1159676.1 endolytic transglycosylase MltG [Chelatococcus sp. SYSU_G07232]
MADDNHDALAERDNDHSGERAAAPRVAPRSPSEAIKPMAAPPPPPKTVRRRRGGFLSALSGFFTFLAVAALGVGGAVYVGKRQFSTPGPLAEDKVVIVKGGNQAVAETLQREGVISQPMLFVIGLHLSGANDDIKAGEYLFRQGASMRDVMDTLVAGRTVLHSITIPEGLTSEQIVARLMEIDVLTGEVREPPREGSLLPETYKVPRGTTRQSIIERMAQDQRKVVNEVWARRSPELPIRTPHELVTLASIVEKETGRADERTRVAGVFINRLQKKMKLQSDPTIVYGIVGGKGTLGRGILKSEINQATPYNTYVIDGLPPGPIANPGRAALEAAANPSRTRDLYFVADGNGGHVFAETLDQHAKNVARWRQIEAQKAAAGKADTAVDRVDPTKDDVRGDAPAVPAGAAAFAPTGVETFPVPAGRQPGGKPGQRSRAFDASEGTDRDPLRNKTYDLNSPKTVPAIRP